MVRPMTASFRSVSQRKILKTSLRILVIRFKISKANLADHITDDISHGILIEITKNVQIPSAHTPNVCRATFSSRLHFD